MEDLKLACVLDSWQRSKTLHPLYMWGLIDVNKGKVVKFFLFYEHIKHNNITRSVGAPKAINEWVEERGEELGCNPTTKVKLVVKRNNQENSKQIKGFLRGLGQDFQVDFVDGLASQGVTWGDSLLETLYDLAITRKAEDLITKMKTDRLVKEDIASLRKTFTEAVKKLHLPPDDVSKGQKGQTKLFIDPHIPPAKIEDEKVDKAVAFSQLPLVTPDFVIGPNEESIWLGKLNEELQELVTSEDEVMSTKHMRESWAEAFKMTRNARKSLLKLTGKVAASQEKILQKQGETAELLKKVDDIVQDIRRSLKKKIKEKGETLPLRGGIDEPTCEALLRIPLPKDTHHARVEKARKQIVYTLLFYTGARANEVRELTHTDLTKVAEEGVLRLVLHKQGDAIERVIPHCGQEAMKKLAPEIDLVFNQQGYKFLGESFKMRGQAMHEKAWLNYLNKDIKRIKESRRIAGSLTTHSFRAGFVSRLLKHATVHVVAQIIGHRNVATTLKYNRYAIDKEETRKILDKGFENLLPSLKN